MPQNVSDGADAGSVSGKIIGTSERVLPATGRESGVPGQVVSAPGARFQGRSFLWLEGDRCDRRWINRPRVTGVCDLPVSMKEEGRVENPPLPGALEAHAPRADRVRTLSL